MVSYFYDIESLDNVFTLANYRSDADAVDIYYLVDDEALMPDELEFKKNATDRIHAKNRNFTGEVFFFNLKEPESNRHLARTFGLSDARYANNPHVESNYDSSYRLRCDTDPDYDEEHDPFLLGYNSFNYDTTMLAYYLYTTFTDGRSDKNTEVIMPPTAKSMREYNDELFLPQFKSKMYERLRYSGIGRRYKANNQMHLDFGPANFVNPPAVIRKNMLMSGRHLDVARLNEKQSHVGLKRLLGNMGYQILESDKLRPGQNHIESEDQLVDLIAYNVSDVVNLKKLNEEKTYVSSFTLKRQLLKTYPELVYECKSDGYGPDIRPTRVRNDRMTIDSSSAQMATKSLCPYGHLEDYDVVSFMYPSEEKAKKYNIPRVNVLEESKKFFYQNFSQFPELCEKFDAIYDYYKQIEGKNFNAGKNYYEDHGIDLENTMGNPDDELPDELRPQDIEKIPVPNTLMFYYNADGTPSNCFVNFSTGGIHGAEYNKALFDKHMEEYQAKLAAWQEKVDLLNRAKQLYPDPCDLKKEADTTKEVLADNGKIKKLKGVFIDGIRYKASDFLQPKATATSALYKDQPKKPVPPELFVKPSNSNSYKLNEKYTFTSAAKCQHEDFTSYYPNMLRMMDAFYNSGLGYDRYGEIFDQKSLYGKYMKDKARPQEERDLYSVLREGTKLILNSASGAGDANFDSNVRMNNKIISMRIIGQLFTWRIGQAQTLKGASIISTNTDGLYSTGLDEEINNRVLAEEAENIHVEIEPEPIYLISKDSNNRTEVKINDDNSLGDIVGASGGSLACRKGPNVTKSLAHAAAIDWALTEYLIVAATGYKGSDLCKPMDEELGMSILRAIKSNFDKMNQLRMFQIVVSSSPGSNQYVFGTKDDDPDMAIPLQHYNRCFIMKDKSPNCYHLKKAITATIADSTKNKRIRENLRPRIHDLTALEILKVNGVDVSDIEQNKEAAIQKISGIEEAWYVKVINDDLHLMSEEEMDEILDSLDYDKYLLLLRQSFEKNWQNKVPGVTPDKVKSENNAESEEPEEVTE